MTIFNLFKVSHFFFSFFLTFILLLYIVSKYPNCSFSSLHFSQFFRSPTFSPRIHSSISFKKKKRATLIPRDIQQTWPNKKTRHNKTGHKFSYQSWTYQGNPVGRKGPHMTVKESETSSPPTPTRTPNYTTLSYMQRTEDIHTHTGSVFITSVSVGPVGCVLMATSTPLAPTILPPHSSSVGYPAC